MKTENTLYFTNFQSGVYNSNAPISFRAITSASCSVATKQVGRLSTN